VITSQAGTRLGLIRSFAADGALALAIAVAAAVAASGAPVDGPSKAFLVLLAFLAGLSLVARRRYPVLVLALTVLVTGFFTLAYDGYWPFAALLAFYSVSAHSSRRTALISGVIGLVALGLQIATLINWEQLTWSKLALLAGRLAPLVAAWILGDNVRTRRAYVRAVEDRAAQLEREHEANARRAAAEEQARIAREVHDVVAHNLSVIIVQATAAERVFESDPPSSERAVRAIGITARQALGELRRVLGVVRIEEPEPLELAPQPSLESLDPLLDRVRTAGLEVEVERSGEPRALPSALELSAYRIVQEALTNTLRHAGARRATVRLHFDDDALGLEIVDDGTGTAGGNGDAGRGLVGMRERAAIFGGQLEAGPTAGGGFRVTARLPLAAADS
jgi:signal transduction histidine kinase